MKHPSTITSLPPSPADERHSRVVKYGIAMGIRMVCIVCLLFSHGWWILIFGLGAVILPYIAVVLANVGGTGEGGAPDRPGGLVTIERTADGGTRASTPAPDAPTATAADPDAAAAQPSAQEPPEQRP
ncbi:DUF3099 domain-containing protein [Microbacteriaceae bacterium VKM Ac-2854]|nr:DUF3099 domain-containing protein [Microbacteriaceae bacterium VKM Ac-2854]